MYKLNEKSKNSIKRFTGIDAQSISEMTDDSLRDRINVKSKDKLRFYKKILFDPRLVGRGQVYMYLLRLVSMKIIDRKLSKI
jgi:hypothetical protein